MKRGPGSTPRLVCWPAAGSAAPETATAVADHAIGAADVAVIRSVLARMPTHLGTEQRALVEAELARQARILDAGQLAVLGKRMLAYLDPPAASPATPRSSRSSSAPVVNHSTSDAPAAQ